MRFAPSAPTPPFTTPAAVVADEATTDAAVGPAPPPFTISAVVVVVPPDAEAVDGAAEESVSASLALLPGADFGAGVGFAAAGCFAWHEVRSELLVHKSYREVVQKL